jgi:hypothetical protein
LGLFADINNAIRFAGVRMMKITAFGTCVVVLATVVVGCAMQTKKTEQQVKAMPVNCATADGDLRMLNDEKKTTLQRIASGVGSVAPIGLVAGVATGTAGTKYRVATGAYNKMLDDKIAEIKQACPQATAEAAAADATG